MIRASISDHPNHQISLSGNNIVSYSEVVEKNNDGSFVINKFSNFNMGDRLDENAINEFNTSNILGKNEYALTSNNIERGKLLKQEFYSNIGSKLKEISYLYNNNPNRKSNFIKCIKNQLLGTCNFCLNSEIRTSWAYKIYTYSNFISHKDEIDYLQNGSITKSWDYIYDDYNNIIESRESLNNNQSKVIKRRFITENAFLFSLGNAYYNLSLADYNTASGYFNLIQKSLFSYPIEETELRYDNLSGLSKVISSKLYYYDPIAPIMSNELKLLINSPLTLSTYNSNTTFNYSYYKPISGSSNYTFDINSNYSIENSITKFGTHGEILQMKNRQNIYTYTYDYNAERVVSITKSPSQSWYDYKQVAHTSFEGKYDNTTNGSDINKGNLNFNSNGINNNISLTGSKSYTLSSSNSISFVNGYLVPGALYNISFWVCNSPPYISTPPTFTGAYPSSINAKATISNWTLYEENIWISGNNFTINGNCNIDELRLYPYCSNMQTVTYDVINGITSMCDDANRITYYEYDDMGRLKIIRDQNLNIIKKYEYGIQTTE